MAIAVKVRFPVSQIIVIFAFVLGWSGAMSFATNKPTEHRPAGKPIYWGRANESVDLEVSAPIVDIAAIGYFSYALQHDGTPVLLADSVYPDFYPPSDATNIVDIDGGFYHVLGLRRDGTVSIWGGGGGWVLKDKVFAVPHDLTNTVAIAAGMNHSLALRADGTVVAWGDNTWGEINVPKGLSNVVSLAAGQAVSIAVLSDGTIRAWGHLLYYGFTSNELSLTNIKAVSAGAFGDCLALRNDGTVVAWQGPWNALGQSRVPVGLSNVVAIASAAGQCYALRSDGTAVGWGRNDDLETVVPNTGKLVAIDGGVGFGLALRRQPHILNASTNFAFLAGDDLRLTIETYDAVPYEYSLRLGNGSVITSTNSTFTVPNLQAFHSGPIHALITSASLGSDSKVIGSVNVTPSRPRGKIDPNVVVVRPGHTATFKADIRGTDPILMQWVCSASGTVLSTNAELVLDNVGWGGRDECLAFELIARNEAGQTAFPASIVLLASGAFRSPRVDENQLAFELAVEPGRKYLLESSPDLKFWTVVLEFASTRDVVDLREPIATNPQMRFYRLVSATEPVSDGKQ